MEDARINWNLLFVEFSRPQWDSLFRFCISLIKNKISAEDLHQTALLKSLNAFAKFIINYSPTVQSDSDVRALFTRSDIQYHFKNWMYKITKNSFLDQKEAEKKWSYEDKEELANQLPDNSNSSRAFATINKANDILLQQEQSSYYKYILDDEWKKKFDTLNEKQRSIIFLAAEDYSYKEISHILEIPIGTVMSSLSRALQKLKKYDNSSK